jgi:hypothetical protein
VLNAVCFSWIRYAAGGHKIRSEAKAHDDMSAMPTREPRWREVL